MNRLFLFTLLLSLETNAQVAVYRTQLAGTVTGGSNSVHASLSGYTVLDASTGVVARVQIANATKEFKVEQLNWIVTTAYAKTKTYTLLIESTNFLDGGELTSESVFAKGANSRVTLHGGQILEVPRSFSVITKSTYPETGAEFLQEASGTLVLDTIRTSEFAVPGGTVQGTVDLIRADLIQRGFHEITTVTVPDGAQLETEDRNFLTTEDGALIVVDEPAAPAVAGE